MKTAREFWGLADRVAHEVRGSNLFDMNLCFHGCGTPSCLAGWVRHVEGYPKTTKTTMEWATEALGIPAYPDMTFSMLFSPQGCGFPRDLEIRYLAGDRQEAAIEAMYREVEKAHGPRPSEEPTPVYEIPDWRRVVREIQMEEAEGVGA